ncbi:MAG: tRNA (N(6)-L-threonylcarbamoyladenosine(37)-C(2))-methylthiotransferase MtaB [Firmicutes bacterium]|nr:tRNA (N(6)-L-threonylcarbamoyladenosine(37)-C(2))-methylthiotransferase MtaB [Bacillota bacterium]
MHSRVSFSIHTLGCKVNQYEGERIVADLKRMGWDQVDFSSSADVYIINSCTVTAVANHKSRQLIRRALKNNPESLVVVTGCYADSDRDEIAQIEGIDLIVGNDQKRELPRVLAEKLGMEASSKVSGDKIVMPLHTRALVKIQDGCNQFCSYCIVPYVRGNLWSRPQSEIVDEVSRLVATGTQEIVLTGIHLGLYGNGTGNSLGSLLRRLIDIRGLGRIRLSSIELNEITPDIVELISTSGKVCNHLHIPLQSGSDSILAKMNRRYTQSEFVERTDELKQKIDGLAITTDVIVGFPGETDNDFNDTAELVERVGFSKLHVFKFSPRAGTPAATYNNQVASSVKDSRSAQLIDISRKLSSKFASNYVGKNLSVLVERAHGKYLSGISDNYIRVHIEGGTQDAIGRLVNVNIDEQENAILYGRIV